MSQSLIKILVPLIVGIPLAIISIRYFFKGSVLLSTILYWAITILLTDTIVNLSFFFPKFFPQYFTIPFVGIVIILFFKRSVNEVKTPLNESITTLQLLTKGDLNVTVNEKYLSRKNELGNLNRSIKELSSKLQEE